MCGWLNKEWSVIKNYLSDLLSMEPQINVWVEVKVIKKICGYIKLHKIYNSS